MLGRKELNSQPVSLAEVKKILQERSKEPDFGYEQQTCLDYANAFCKLKEQDAKKLVEELMKIEGMTLDAAIKITDILPPYKTTLNTILAKDKITLDEDKLTSVLELVKKASGKKISPPPKSVEPKEDEKEEEASEEKSDEK